MEDFSYGCSGFGFLIDCQRPKVKINWLQVSAIEWTASENNEADPVYNHPIVLTIAFVALLSFGNGERKFISHSGIAENLT